MFFILRLAFWILDFYKYGVRFARYFVNIHKNNTCLRTSAIFTSMELGVHAILEISTQKNNVFEIS